MRVRARLGTSRGGVNKVLLAGLALLLLLIATASWWWAREPGALGDDVRASNSQAVSGSADKPARFQGAVGCLGHIEPENGVLQVSAPYLDGRPQRVSELKVQQGDHVRRGQLLAVLDGHRQLQTAAQVADAQVALAQAKLSDVKAGATRQEIAAQKAVVQELRDEVENARSEYARYTSLKKNTDVSVAELESRHLAVTTAEQRLEQAQQHLEDISRPSPGDVDIAEAELKVAIAESQAAHARLLSAFVHAPMAGQVLRIIAHRGEEVGPQGLLELGKTDSMYVEAEVYETDITRVHPGQRATIRSALFSGPVTGTVETVGTTLSKNSVLPLDPVAFAEARVFKVWIRLDDGSRVAGLIHGKVDVTIQP